MKRRSLTPASVASAVLLATPLPASTATAADTRPGISHEALYLMQRVGAPVPSPDGTRVVFSLTEPTLPRRAYGPWRSR